MSIFKRIGLALIILSVANLLLVLTCLYWWVFANELPPFIQGRPLDDVMVTLAMVSVSTGFIGGIIWSEN